MKISGSKLAAEFGVSRMRVSQLAAEGVIPKGRDGKFDVLEAYRAYCSFLRKALAARPVPEPGAKHGTIVDARRRKITADAEMAELELARERGQLVSIADVEREMTNLIVTTKARMMAVGGRVAPELVGETSRNLIAAKIEKATKEALVQLAGANVAGLQFPTNDAVPPV